MADPPDEEIQLRRSDGWAWFVRWTYESYVRRPVLDPRRPIYPVASDPWLANVGFIPIDQGLDRPHEHPRGDGSRSGGTVVPMIKVRDFVKPISNIHREDGRPNVFLFSTPRSGSTWLMELISTQPGFKYINQPLSLINARVRRHLGISDWLELYSVDAAPKLERYFQAFRDGRMGFANPNPLRKQYRPVTHRIVFKEIHGCADRINWVRDSFNARIVYLVRHPMAVSISRGRFHTLRAFLESDYRRHLSSEQLTFADRVLQTGTELEVGVLSWCLQNMVPLRDATDDWAIIAYEQLVLDPDPVIQLLCRKLELPNPERMRDRLIVPSVSKVKSSSDTRQLLDTGDSDKRARLIDKWRKRVDEREEGRAMQILEVFQLDIYRAGDLLPAKWAWIAPDPSPGAETLRGTPENSMSRYRAS